MEEVVQIIEPDMHLVQIPLNWKNWSKQLFHILSSCPQKYIQTEGRGTTLLFPCGLLRGQEDGYLDYFSKLVDGEFSITFNHGKFVPQAQGEMKILFGVGSNLIAYY